MPTFRGSHSERRSLRISAERAAAAFAELPRQVTCHPELAEAQIVGADVLKIRLKEMSHGPVQFSGHYTLTFVRDGNVVRWSSGPDGNVIVKGRAEFVVRGAGCEMSVEEECAMDMDVNRFLGGVIRPVAETMMSRGMKGFVARMAESLDALPVGA